MGVCQILPLFILADSENFMSLVQVVKQFEFRERPIVAPPIFVRVSLFLTSNPF